MALEFVGRFILTDETLDRDSERVIVKGIDIEPFKRNPVMFYNHIRTVPGWWGGETISDDAVLPIGRWENIKKVDGTQIEADAYVDMDDEFAAKIGKKVANGIISSVSIGFRAKAYSDAEEDKVMGQTGLTITKAELHEASLVDIPANTNATILSKTYREKSASSDADGPGEILFTKTFYKKDISMKSDNLFEAVKAFFKGFSGKDLTNEAEALAALQEGAETPNLSLDTVKAAIVDDMKSAIEAAQVAMRSEFTAKMAELATQVGNLAEALENPAAEETEPEIDELKASMDALAAKVANLSASRSGGQKPVEGASVTKGKEEGKKDYENRQEVSLRGIVKAGLNSMPN